LSFSNVVFWLLHNKHCTYSLMYLNSRFSTFFCCSLFLIAELLIECTELLAGERTVGSKLRQEEVHDVRHRSVDLLTDRSEILDADLLRKSFNVGWTNLDLDLLGKSGVVFMEFLSDTLKQFLVASVIIYWLLFGRFGWFVFDDGFLSLLLALVELDDAELSKLSMVHRQRLLLPWVLLVGLRVSCLVEYVILLYRMQHVVSF